jgi:hypothetical protein
MAATETMLPELLEQVLCTQNIDGISVGTALQQVLVWILANAILNVCQIFVCVHIHLTYLTCYTVRP